MGIQRLYLCLLVASLSSCAVLNHNKDLSLTRDIQAASILDLQSVKLTELPPAKNKPVIAVYRDSFQDLTGQVIQRITNMITDVESRLVNLVAMAGHVDQMTGIQHKEPDNTETDIEDDPNKGVGPQLNAEDNEDVASNQDDVDDLLSSLGF